MRLHKILVEKIYSFLLNIHSVYNFRLLPIMFHVQQASLTCSGTGGGDFSETFSIFQQKQSFQSK